MVTFICYHCDKTLKKPQVEKHVKTQCKRDAKLICIDCKKMFTDDHAGHTSCLSEKQLYWGQYANKGKPQPPQAITKPQQEEQKKESQKEQVPDHPAEEKCEWPGWRNKVNQIVKESKKQQIKLSKVREAAIKEFLRIFPECTEDEANQQFDDRITKSKKLEIVDVPYLVKKTKQD